MLFLKLLSNLKFTYYSTFLPNSLFEPCQKQWKNRWKSKNDLLAYMYISKLIYCQRTNSEISWKGDDLLNEKNSHYKSEGKQELVAGAKRSNWNLQKAVKRPKKEGSLEKSLVDSVRFFSVFNWKSVNIFLLNLLSELFHVKLHVIFLTYSSLR